MIGQTDPQQSLVHQKVCYARQWLDNVSMHMYAKYDQNIPGGSRVVKIFNNWLSMQKVLISSTYKQTKVSVCGRVP